ncbi:uncharacterized protein LOC129737900 [Uranotaenia lowii]|uniref:uncharacterized protein LOC129737900 n=1 Tax=Uranotaenia lowii TaxID=190385 RepID=UPI00247A98F3|nr:uncharacterized protein LOC129737900 [Uranotaenia lowii]
MASKPFEPNVFLKLKKCIAGLRKSIAFLKECLHLGLTPVSHKVVVNEKVPSKLVKKLESGFIKDSVEKLYAQLNIKTLKCYALHLKLARDYPIEFPAFLTKVKVAEKCEERRKERVLRNKLELLKARQPPRNYEKPSVAVLDGFVVNRSKEEFTDKQIDLLNKGLNYAVSRKPRMDQIIIDVETAIRSSKLSTAQKDCARAEVADVLRKGINGKSNVEEIQIAKELRRKEVFYVKADKGNSVVIMDKTDYNGLMQAKIDEGPYRVRREDPLPEMVKEVEKTLKDCGPILGFAPGALKVSAPIVLRIKGLPKIHKPGNEMREIISGVNAPTEEVAKWLLNEFKRMPKPFKTRSVTNTLEFVNRLQASGGIEEDEVMVSFDVSALFPSVPVKEASNLLEDWLLQQHNGSTWKLKVRNYKKLVDLYEQKLKDYMPNVETSSSQYRS